MHKALNELSSYCKSWKLKINMNKSKIMCLNETVNPNVHIDNEYLEHVTEYCYLGVVFTNTVQFHSAIDNVYKKSPKALFKLLHILKPLPSAKTMFHPTPRLPGPHNTTLDYTTPPPPLLPSIHLALSLLSGLDPIPRDSSSNYTC